MFEFLTSLGSLDPYKTISYLILFVFQCVVEHIEYFSFYTYMITIASRWTSWWEQKTCIVDN